MDFNGATQPKKMIAYMEEYECQCWVCYDPYELGERCERRERLISHGLQVCQLDRAYCKLVTLIVGPENIRLTASRVTLAYYSKFFNIAFYGSFAESQAEIMDLPEDDPEAITAFLGWAKTGQIYSNLNLEELWALGVRLQSELFTNEVMHCIFARDSMTSLRAESADLAYSLTSTGSKLRTYMRHLIIIEGPLRKSSPISSDKTRVDGWMNLIRKGGDIVCDIIIEERASFSQNEVHVREMPYHHNNQDLYLEEALNSTIEEFVDAKRKEGKL